MTTLDIKTLFPDAADQVLAQRRLKRVLVGEGIKLGDTRYIKVSDTQVRLAPTPAADQVVQRDEQNAADATEEITWANILVAEFGDRLRVVRSSHNGALRLHTLNTKTRELRLANVDAVQAQMRTHIGAGLKLKDANAAIRRAMDTMECSTEYCIDEHKIAPLLLIDTEPERYCYKRLAISSQPLDTCPPRFAELLSLVSAEDGRRAVTLWLGSVLDPDTTRIQYLCLYGGGNNGKSTLLDALLHTLGSAAITMTSGEVHNRFGLSDAAGKRLMVFDDSNNASFMSSGDFKRITGSATISVEQKGKDRFQTQNNIKVIIATNRMPTLVGDNADLRRNLFVRTEPYTGPANEEWMKEFSASMPDTLRYCYTQFQAHKKEAGGTRIPEVAGGRELMTAMSTMEEAEDFIAEFFTETAGQTTVTPNKVRALLDERRIDPGVKRLVKELLALRYEVTRGGPNNPRFHKGLFMREKLAS